jgi:hypothetical protein
MKVMRIIKFLVFCVVTLFIALTGLSLLFPSDLRISRVVNVATPKPATLRAIADLQSWEKWNQFVRNPQLTNKKYSPVPSGAGAWFSSDQLKISETGIDTNGIALQWDLKGAKTYRGGIDVLSVNRDSLTVQWWFDLHFRWYPWEKLGAFVYDRKLGPVMEESLDSLRLFLEKSQ